MYRFYCKEVLYGIDPTRNFDDHSRTQQLKC